MASSSAGAGGAAAAAGTFSRLVDRTRVPDPSLQRHAVVAFFRHLLSLPAPLPASAHDAASALLTSPRPAVAAHAAASLARLAASRPDLLPLDLAFPLLLAPLSANPSPRLAAFFVKAVAALAARALRSGSRFPPHDHPFVHALASGADGVRAELARQAARMVAEGVDGVVRFLRPFVMFSLVRRGDAPFARDLIGALAAAAAAVTEPIVAIPVLKLLEESLLHFGRGDGEEARLWLSCAECLVDAYVLLLKKLAHTQMSTHNTQARSAELIETLLSQCSLHQQLIGITSTVLGLSKHLFSVQKDLGLCYIPEVSSVLGSLSYSLSGLEFEHEQLAGLKLLGLLIEWKYENEHESESAHNLNDELLCVLPVIHLAISPSNSVKAAASHVLSRFSLLVLDLPASHLSEQQDISMFYHISKPSSIISKLLRHLWSKPSSSGFFFMKYTVNKVSPDSDRNCLQTIYWTRQINDYLTALRREKLTLDDLSSKTTSSATSSLVSSVLSVLVMHPQFATSAAQSLATLGASNPRLGMPLFVVILFYSKILYSNNNWSAKILLSLLESLPSLAIHGFVLPLALQWISPMLKKDANPALYATAVRLLCKIWIATDWAFPNLQVILDPENLSNFISNREISTSIAASVRDVCKQNPDRGVDIILSISFCIESHDSLVQALGLEGLSYLCEADVIDFYTAWKVISKELLDYSADPNIAHSLCALLRWGAMDAEAYSGISKDLIGILWNIGTTVASNSEPLWIKARGTAFHSLSYYKVSLIQDAIPDFRKRNYELFVSECNMEVLKAMENFQDEIIKFEHINRRRVTTDKRVVVHKFEKLLDVFPQTVFKGKLMCHQLPGAALLTVNFTPKDILNERKSKDLSRVHAAYEQAFTEMAESMYISRNLEVALLVLHSWKSFVSNWMQAVVALLDSKDSSKLNKASRAANDIFKILCSHVPVTPQVTVNIALVIGALCSIVPPAAHLVISSAAEFLIRWLFQYEHEHQQWSAALSLGLIFNCFHPTDRKSKFQVINGLREVISKTESCLVKGACGLALGYTCHGLLNGAHIGARPEVEATTKSSEHASVEDILHTLVTSLIQLCPSSSYSLRKLSICGIDFTGCIEENANSFDDDPWAIAGLVHGLGNSVVALYKLGAYEAVTDVKNILISWIPHADSSSALFDETNSASLCMGSCLALPSVIAFCQRVELLNDDLDALLTRYTSLASKLLNLKKSGTIFQNLLMAICIGAGSFLSCILDDGIHAMDFCSVKRLLDTFKHIYTHPFPPLVHLGAMFGVVNAFGAGAEDLIGMMCLKPMTSQIQHEDSSMVRGPVLTSHVGETLSTSMIQEIFLLAKDAEDKHIQEYAAWAISFLRSRLLSSNQNLYDDHDSDRNSGDPNQSSHFSEQSLVWNLSLWLSDLKIEKPGDMVPASTIGIVFKCLSKAPRLPTTDWGVIVRRCMKIEAQVPQKSTSQQDLKLLKESCLFFSLVHAKTISPLLQFLDDLTDILRFQRLDIDVQSILLQHLSHLMKLFSDSRLEKLYQNLAEYLYSSASPFLNYSSEQQSMIRVSFWKGICKCLLEVVSEESDGFPFIKKCMECLLPLLTICNDGQPEFMDEWSAAIKCLGNAKKSWLDDILQVCNAALIANGKHVDVTKKIIIKARLCAIGHGSVHDLEALKSTILCTKADDVWWNVLVEVAAAICSSENSVRRQWLLDALDVGCVADHPLTALRFVGLLCGSCCIYMPLLIFNSTNVLSDLPVTLPSFLSSSIWDDFRTSVAEKLWLLTTRIYTWAEQLTHRSFLIEHDHIDGIEADMANFVANVLRSTCVAVAHYFSVDKQLKLANLEALRS